MILRPRFGIFMSREGDEGVGTVSSGRWGGFPPPKIFQPGKWWLPALRGISSSKGVPHEPWWTVHVGVLGGVCIYDFIWFYDRSTNQVDKEKMTADTNGSNDSNDQTAWVQTSAIRFQDRIVLISNWTQTLDLIERLWSWALRFSGDHFRSTDGFVRNGGNDGMEGRMGPAKKFWKEYEETGKNA